VTEAVVRLVGGAVVLPGDAAGVPPARRSS
jgi:hypothetical protein